MGRVINLFAILTSFNKETDCNLSIMVGLSFYENYGRENERKGTVKTVLH